MPSPQEETKKALGAWLRALECTASIARDPHTTFPILINQLAKRYESAPALISHSESLSYRELAARVNRYARWACREGFARGATVGLLMDNCADYLALWLGLTRAGLTVALLNSHLTGQALAHSIRIVKPSSLILSAHLAHGLETIRDAVISIPLWTHGGKHCSLPRIDEEIKSLPEHPLDTLECALPLLKERALYIYTSGTTGLPKAAIVSHYRIMQWTHWFCGMMGITSADRMYNCLPLYHSVGGVIAAGAPLVGGGSVVIRERFSASGFWHDVSQTHCTLFQYIGELCRYLLANPQQDPETAHTLRLACGNGLQKHVWTAFKERFRIPQILEYYASTEGNFSLYNCEGKPGSIGRIPPFLSHRHTVTIIRSDPDSELPLRDVNGHCIPCAPNEVGEVIGEIPDRAKLDHATFEGYSDSEATYSKILRNVFVPGDQWYRAGDLMSRDKEGFFYFIDRVGDTFRWKGENISTMEVASILRCCRGVLDAAVYGVQVPLAEGRACMAALVVDTTFDSHAFHRETVEKLPAYARPIFLRILPTLEKTATFKLQKKKLVDQGYPPAGIDDTIYIKLPDVGGYVPIDGTLYKQLLAGHVRL